MSKRARRVSEAAPQGMQCSSERYKHEANRPSRNVDSISQPQIVRVPTTREFSYSGVEFAVQEYNLISPSFTFSRFLFRTQYLS
jgi:hypothetical protein